MRALAPQPFGEEPLRDRRQCNELPRGLKDAVGEERVHVRVEVDEVVPVMNERLDALEARVAVLEASR